MKTLINPTEDEINAAVAEHVAGWRPNEQQMEARRVWAEISEGEISKEEAYRRAYAMDIPRFTRSADAVLPLLEKYYDWWNVSHAPGDGREFYCEVNLPDGYEQEGMAKSPTFPLAACIALLRAKDIQVEFK